MLSATDWEGCILAYYSSPFVFGCLEIAQESLVGKEKGLDQPAKLSTLQGSMPADDWTSFKTEAVWND